MSTHVRFSILIVQNNRCRFGNKKIKHFFFVEIVQILFGFLCFFFFGGGGGGGGGGVIIFILATGKQVLWPTDKTQMKCHIRWYFTGLHCLRR